MLSPEDAIIIHDAVRDGVFWGSFYGAIVFHIFLFSGMFIMYYYFAKKYGNTVKSYGDMISSILGIKR